MIIQKAAEQAQVEEEEVIEDPPPPPLFQEDDDYEDDDDEDDDYENEDREEEVLPSDEEEEEEKEEGKEDEEEEEENDEECASSDVIPTSDFPYMVIHHGIGETEHTFYSISKGICSDRSIPEMYGATCCASSNGWLVMLDNSGSDANSNIRYCLLLNSVSMELVHLPPIKTSYSCTFCILTSSPPDCVVMFFSFDDNSCLFCRPNDKRWTRKFLGRKFGDGKYNTCFQVPFGAVSCQGKIYINYGHGGGMKILEYNDDDSMIIGNRFTVEKIKFNENLMDSFNSFTAKSMTFNYLVESNGEVFLVIRNYIRSNTSNTHSFSVYKLMNTASSSSSSKQGGRIVWKKVESLGDDRVFFLAHSCSYSVCASKSGLMENHIYFFHPVDHRYLYRFSMDNGSIYKTLCFPHVAATCRIEPYWMISNSIL